MTRLRHAPLAAALALALTSAPARALTPDEVAAWRFDLAFVGTELPKIHANAFHSTTREAFEAALDSLSTRAPRLTSAQMTIGLARVVAGIGDGHTRLTLPLDPKIEFFRGHASTPDPKLPGLTIRHYPIRLDWLDDGLYVGRVERAHSDLAGGRVIGIGGVSADSALATAARSVEHDNDGEARLHAAEWLVLPEAVEALGIVEDMEHARFRVRRVDGREVTATLAPVPPGRDVEWVDARRGPAPLHLRNTDRNFWFEFLPDSRTVYFAYNEVNDESDETLERFAVRLFEFIRSNPVDRLVIDLRHNRGGNNSLSRPLLHGLIRCEEVQKPGALYAIVGRSTFSAAMMFAVDLERHTNVIFVGEPTGARPNGYGDARRVTLPNTGLTMRVSTLYWQYSDPRDERDAIAPHLQAPLTAPAWREGRDPAMETILAGLGAEPDRTAPSGAWEGVLRFGPEQYDVVFRFLMKFRAKSGDEGWGGVMDIPAAGIEAAPVHVSAATPESVAFDMPVGDVRVTCAARVQGDRMLAVVNYRGRTTAMVLERRP